MATPFLQELIDLVGDTEAKRIYRGITRERADHDIKHARALAAADPARKAEFEALEAVMEAVKADPDVALIRRLDPPIPPEGPVRG